MDASDSLQLARDAIQNRNMPLARQILQQIIEADPNNETAWYLYAHVAENRQTAIYCLEKTLELNTSNQQARQELAHLQGGTASQSSAPIATKENNSSANQPMHKRASTARTKSQGIDQRYIIWGAAAVIGLVFVCGLVGLFVIVQQLQARQVASVPSPLPGYSLTISTPTPPLPQIASVPTQDASCSCAQATAYLNNTAQRYQVVGNDITTIEKALQNQTISQLDFALLSGEARTLYHDQLQESSPPCLQPFQSKTIQMFWNWQQSMEYLAGGEYNTAQVFIQGFVEQMTALEGEGKKMRGLLQSCPGNNLQNPTF